MVHYEADFQAAKTRAGRGLSDLELEVEVMRRVVHAIEMLDEPEARRRVAQWAMERVHADAVQAARIASAAPAVAETVMMNGDPDLAVDGIADFFPHPQRKHGDNQTVAEAPQGVDTMIRGFAADLRRFALEWHGA